MSTAWIRWFSACGINPCFCLSIKTNLIVCHLLSLLWVSGEKGSLTHGSVVDGRFEGFIKTYQGTYYVEPSERYLQDDNVPFHSVIYHEDDVSKFDFSAFIWRHRHNTSTECGGGSCLRLEQKIGGENEEKLKHHRRTCRFMFHHSQ